MSTIASPPPGAPRRAALTGGWNHDRGAVVVEVAQTPEPYRARRRLDDDEVVLDDHQRLHVDCTSLTETWTFRATREGLTSAEAGVWRRCADELLDGPKPKLDRPTRPPTTVSVKTLRGLLEQWKSADRQTILAEIEQLLSSPAGRT